MRIETIKIDWSTGWKSKRELEKSKRNANKKLQPFPVRICRKCNSAWEWIHKSKHKHKYSWKFLSNFPKYGLKQETCPSCNEN